MFDIALVAVGAVASVGFNEMVWLLHRSPLQHTMLQSTKDQSSSESTYILKFLQPSVTSAMPNKQEKIIIPKNLANKIWRKEKRLTSSIEPNFQPKESFLIQTPPFIMATFTDN